MNEQVQILGAIAVERQRQDQKWGEQNHPDVLAHREGQPWTPQAIALIYGIPTADKARARCDAHAQNGRLTFSAILIEELCEAVEQAALGSESELVTELIQVAAVAVAWIEAIQRRDR